ncbi:MAG: hypothetical protein ACKVIX_02280 [Sphingomonadales bacterium]
MTENNKYVSVPMAFRLTLKQFLAHQEVLSLLALLYSLILLIFSWPVVSGDLPLLPTFVEGDEIPAVWPYLLIFLGTFIFGAIYQSCLARILNLGPGGLILRNKAQMVSDAIKTIGFMIQGLVFMAVWVVPIFIMFSMIATGNENPVLPILTLIFIFIALFAGFAITQALYVSVAAIGRGKHLPLRKAWESLEGNKLKFGLYIVIVFLGLYIVNGVLVNIFIFLGLMESMARFSSAFNFVVYSFLTSLSTFLFMGMADLIARKETNGIT